MYRVNRAATNAGEEVREFKEDIRRLAEIGKACEEYKTIVELLRVDFQVKDLELNHSDSDSGWGESVYPEAGEDQAGAAGTQHPPCC